MLINFRQGIINAQINDNFIQLVDGNVNINVDVDNVDLAIAYGSHNYLFTEAQQVLAAWHSLPSNQTVYLYWDIDLTTAIRTYGYTVLQPTFGSQFPTNPLNDQHFFNFSTNKMYVRSGDLWKEKLRVFAGSVQNNAILIPNGLGSQVNLNSQVNLGYILFNSINKPLRIVDSANIYYFITTEDEIHTQQDVNNSYKIDSLLMDGRAIEPIPAFYCITWKGPKQTGVTSYVDYKTPCIGISVEPSGVDQVKQFVTRGFVTNYINWNFTVPPSTPLFVGLRGEVTTVVPQQYSLQKIGHVVSPNTIFVDIEEIILIENILPPISATPIPSLSSTPSPTMTPTPTPTATPEPIFVTTTEYTTDSSDTPMLLFNLYSSSLCNNPILTDATFVSINVNWKAYNSNNPIITDTSGDCVDSYSTNDVEIADSGVLSLDLSSIYRNGIGSYEIYILNDGNALYGYLRNGCGTTTIMDCDITTNLGEHISHTYLVKPNCA